MEKSAGILTPKMTSALIWTEFLNAKGRCCTQSRLDAPGRPAMNRWGNWFFAVSLWLRSMATKHSSFNMPVNAGIPEALNTTFFSCFTLRFYQLLVFSLVNTECQLTIFSFSVASSSLLSICLTITFQFYCLTDNRFIFYILSIEPLFLSYLFYLVHVSGRKHPTSYRSANSCLWWIYAYGTLFHTDKLNHYFTDICHA